MKNELLTKGIILPSGEIGKNKINLVAGAITQPFAEMVWVTTGGDMETINRLTNVLVWSNMDAASIPLKIFVYGNPMYYWMNFCSCRTMGIIEHLPFYFMGGILLLIVGGIAMSKKEIK